MGRRRSREFALFQLVELISLIASSSKGLARNLRAVRGIEMRVTRTGIFLAILLGFTSPTLAAEGGTGWYLLGSKTELSGYLPPPGVYAQSLNYYYSGSANADLDIAGLTLSGGIDADAFYSLPTALWVLGQPILGGNLALSATGVVGWKDVRAGASLTGPGGATIARDIDGEDFNLGDPVLGATLGWHEGKFNWTLGALVNVPIGYWEKGNLSNIGFNHWGIDATAAVTWLDPDLGAELSVASGITFNFENPDTNYKSGTEFHAEFAATKIVSQQFSFGLVGYYYNQITGDSGEGAKLGDFKGHVAAIGPALNYTFMAGQTPIATNLRYFHEFDVENRLAGDAFFLVVTVPVTSASE
jgi:hypothetical protein